MDSLIRSLERIAIDGDLSQDAARALESAIAERDADPRFDQLEQVLALYRPGGGEFMFDESQLRRECAHVLKLLRTG